MLYPEKIQGTESFEELINVAAEIIQESNPVLATSMGTILYNNLWPDISIHGVNKDIETLKAILSKLREFDNIQGSTDDYELLRWYLKVNLHELEELRLWESAPYLSRTVLTGIHQLTQKTYPDQTTRVQSIIARLRSVAPLIKGEQRRLIKPFQKWIEIEQKSITNLVDYLQSLPGMFNSKDQEILDDLHQSIEFASDELHDHLEWLTEVNGQEFEAKPEAYAKLLELRKIGFSVDELEHLGKEYLEWTDMELNKLSTKLDGDSVEQVRKKIRSDHAPDFDTVIENYKQLADQARNFLTNQDIVTIPEFTFKVEKTPKPMRNFLSIAAASMPGRFDKDQTAYFYCTPHDDPKMLEEHSYAYQPLLISHESFPGHNLHGAAKNQHPSLVRSTIFSSPSANTGLMYSSKLADITEGWGLYAEEMMWRAGFENDPDDPDLRQRFLQVNAMRWRAARIIIDTKLHTGRMTIDEAIAYLMEKTGYHRTTAEAELMMYSRSPAYFSSYLLGKHLLSDLKQKAEPYLDLKEFHDLIIYAGNVPFWHIKANVLTQITK